MTGFARGAIGIAAGLAILAAAGCGPKAEKAVEGSTKVQPISITVSELTLRPVVRTVDVVGTLRGWEEVTVGAKKGGRVLKIYHDFGDTVAPGEPLLELDPVDAKLGLQQAETRLLGDLTKLGVTRKEADEYLKKFGQGERLLTGEEVERRIREIPAVIQTRLAIERAHLAVTRQRQLANRQAGTPQDLQNAENDFDAAQAAYDNALMTARWNLASALASKVAIDVANQTLEDMIVRAPVPTNVPVDREAEKPSPATYSIVKRPVHEGQMVKEGDALFDLVIQRPLRLWANVPEIYTPEVKIGQEVRLTVASMPNETFTGTVARISPSVDSVSRTFQVEALVPNRKGLLRPGGFTKAQIVTRAEAQAIVVPLESVVKFAGVTKIFVVESDKARAIPVTAGLEGKDWVEVTGELPSRGQVVTSGQAMLADGTPVTIREEPKASSDDAPKESN